MMVSDTAIKIPSTPLTGRNSLIIYNIDENEKLYVGNSDVTADRVVGETSGWEVDPTSYYSTDITADIELYGICESGKTVMIKILEVA